jgi:glycosyltransferase involved in cell wall biosynthesis
MVNRTRVGLRFTYNDKWIAGAYYIMNIIHALNTLDDDQKPHIVVLTETRESFEIAENETRYPYLEFIKFPIEIKSYNLYERVVNKVGRILVNRNIIEHKPKYPNLDFLYPSTINGISNNLKKVKWIPDFQEEHLPHFFSDEEIKKRKENQAELAENSDIVVLSSQDAESDFRRLYPNARAKTFVMPFAVTHPNFEDENINEILATFKIKSPYFFAPNQFWAHKNHIIILKAIKTLKDKGIELNIAMSGKEYDNRNLENFSKLKEYINKHQLEKNVVFLGFLPRKVQLCIMKNSLAVIQPSLFEGWSTVVEDAKSLNKYVILSNINVHKEQLSDNVSFFDPNDSNALATILKTIFSNPPKLKTISYQDNVKAFGEKFMQLVHY